MKRLFKVLLALLLVMAALISCKVEVNETGEETIAVRFVVDDEARSLSSKIIDFNPADYYWYYTATKADKSGFTTGAKSEETLIGEKGLSEAVGPFSKGKWNLTLKAYTGTGKENLVCEGTLSNYEISGSVIYMNVKPTKTDKGTGILRIANNISVKGYTGKTLTTQIMKSNGTDSWETITTQDADTTTDSGYSRYTLFSGSYKIVMTCEDNSETYAQGTIVVDIWNGLTTTISGTVDELTVTTNFGSIMSLSEGVITKTNYLATLTNDKTSWTWNDWGRAFDFSPAGVKSDEAIDSSKTKPQDYINMTWIHNPAMFTLVEGKDTARLTLTTYDKTAVKKEFAELEINSDTNALVAAFDIDLTNATLTTGKNILVVSFIEKDLGENVKVWYVDNEGNATALGSKATELKTYNQGANGMNWLIKGGTDGDQYYYDNTTGRIAFQYSRLGTFVVTYSSAKIVSADGDSTVYYSSLSKANEKSTSGDTITLVSDVSQNSQLVISGSKTLTLDLAGKTISRASSMTSTDGLIYVKGNLTVKDSSAQNGEAGTGAIEMTGDSPLFNVSGASQESTATLEIEGGTYTAEKDIVSSNGDENTEDNSTSITITGGTFEAGRLAIYHPQNGTLNIAGGELTSTGASAVEIRAGQATISGTAVLESKATTYNDTATDGVVVGAALAISQHSTECAKNMVVMINSGTFTCAEGGKQVAFVYALGNSKNNNAILKILTELVEEGGINNIEAEAGPTGGTGADSNYTIYKAKAVTD